MLIIFNSNIFMEAKCSKRPISTRQTYTKAGWSSTFDIVWPTILQLYRIRLRLVYLGGLKLGALFEEVW